MAIHLRYETTWYVISNRSLRLRRGIWKITETTITFENVQNVTIQQGPVQRYYGIASVMIRTAGGGGVQSGEEAGSKSATHTGLIEGVNHAHRIRDLIMARVRRSRTAGLGDEEPSRARARGPAWTPQHLALLREMRDTLHQAGFVFPDP